jgi:hypothetical protein
VVGEADGGEGVEGVWLEPFGPSAAAGVVHVFAVAQAEAEDVAAVGGLAGEVGGGDGEQDDVGGPVAAVVSPLS